MGRQRKLVTEKVVVEFGHLPFVLNKTMHSSWMNFFLSMYMLLTVLCTCAFEYTCVGVTVEARGPHWVSSSMVLQWLGRLADELQASAFHHPTQHWGYRHLAFT